MRKKLEISKVNAEELGEEINITFLCTIHPEEEKAEELRLQRLKDFEEKSFQSYDRIHQRLLGN